MVKKNNISDFSALKGKVTFSEKNADAKVSPEVTPAAANKHKESDMGLHIGQSVVMMDSDHRGRIIGLGKTVRIELEDGLVIESAYGEFAVTDKAEIASLKKTKVKAKKTCIEPKRSVPLNPDGSLTIDLHIEAIPGGTKITFIHGIGDGILKAAIRKELNEVLALRCSYSVGDPAVTVVTIR